MTAFLGLAIDLTPVVEPFEQLGETPRRYLMPHAPQRRRQLGMAFRHPYEWPHGIAERRRLEQPQQILQKRRIGLHERRTSTAGTTNLRPRAIGRFQVLQAAIDRAPCYSCRPRYRAHATVARSPSLGRRKQAPIALVETRAHRLVPVPNRCLVNHPIVIDIQLMLGNPPNRDLIRLFRHVALPMSCEHEGSSRTSMSSTARSASHRWNDGGGSRSIRLTSVIGTGTFRDRSAHVTETDVGLPLDILSRMRFSIYRRKSSTQPPPCERNVPSFAEQAMHKDKLLRSPANCLDSLLGEATIVIQEGHMRCVVWCHPAPEPGFRYRQAKSLLKRDQRGDAIASTQDERSATRSADEAHRAVEHDIERRERDSCSGFTRCSDDVSG